MWHLMIFGNEAKTELVKVLSLSTVREVAYVTGVSAQSVSNFYHNLIKPRDALKYVALFKG